MELRRDERRSPTRQCVRTLRLYWLLRLNRGSVCDLPGLSSQRPVCTWLDDSSSPFVGLRRGWCHSEQILNAGGATFSLGFSRPIASCESTRVGELSASDTPPVAVDADERRDWFDSVDMTLTGAAGCKERREEKGQESRVDLHTAAGGAVALASSTADGLAAQAANVTSSPCAWEVLDAKT